MEEEQKVYIKGNPNRGAEVIKALTDLGGINSESYAGDYEKALYYINPKGKIEYVYDYEFSPECLLVKEFYTEIKLPERKDWKDGDLLVKYNGGKKEYLVFSHMDEKNNGNIVSYVYVYDEGFRTNVTVGIRDFKPAPLSDINDFQELLHTHGKEWSFKYKVLVDWRWKLVDWRWKPENNEDYWFISDVGEICHTLYNQFMIRDNNHLKVGNCFQTKEDAFNARDKIKEFLLNK